MSFHPEMSHEEIARAKLEVLRREHRDLDEAIAALATQVGASSLTLQRLKRQKLLLPSITFCARICASNRSKWSIRARPENSSA